MAVEEKKKSDNGNLLAFLGATVGIVLVVDFVVQLIVRAVLATDTALAPTGEPSSLIRFGAIGVGLFVGYKCKTWAQFKVYIIFVVALTVIASAALTVRGVSAAKENPEPTASNESAMVTQVSTSDSVLFLKLKQYL